MLSLYEILKASKTGISPDLWTALAGKNWSGSDSGHEIKELTGVPPLSFRADGTPLLDFLISGNMEQTGTPTPQNPIEPSECGEKTENLFDKNNSPSVTLYPNNENMSMRSDSGVRSTYVLCKPNTTYTICKTAASRFRVATTINAPTNNEPIIDYDSNASGSVITLTTSANVQYLVVFYWRTADTITEEQMRDSIMIIEGSTVPSSYIPFGIKIPILSGGTTTPVYLGEIQSTRQIRKTVFDGTEGWNKSRNDDTAVFSALFPQDAIPLQISGICTHFEYKYIASTNTDIGWYITSGGSSIRIRPENVENMTKEQFQEWLASEYANGTPVTVWYVLATPETAIVNEPIRKIGDYADTLSMEQAGVSIPTVKGNTVIDVDTTLKPSEMYIKYQK